MSIKIGSLFDGSGGFPLAGIKNGMKPMWASEIEPYPLKVTAARFPTMKQLGDVTQIDGAAVDPVDVITFGSPCQDLSVAGKQKGIHEGERSNLFFEAIRIIKEMRTSDRADTRADVNIRPRFAVWENVPGAFSSNKGNDFRAVLQALVEIKAPGTLVPGPAGGKWKPAGCIVGDGYSIAWRTYDAQYWGVPQRRKRIYLIADFASERAGEILFECESMQRDYDESDDAREKIASDTSGSLNAAGFKAGNGSRARGIGWQMEIAPTLASTASGTNQVPTTVYCLQGNGIDRALTAGCNGKGWRENECYTLNTIDRPAVVFDKELYNSGKGCTGGHYLTEDGPAPTVRTKIPPGVCVGYIVRRLTPLECCRLQGFPDWWEDGVEGSDSARYKMWGNGIALPCAVDVLRRIRKAIMDQ